MNLQRCNQDSCMEVTSMVRPVRERWREADLPAAFSFETVRKGRGQTGRQIIYF